MMRCAIASASSSPAGLGDLESDERALMDSRADVLRQSVLEDVDVPLLRGGFEASRARAANVPRECGNFHGVASRVGTRMSIRLGQDAQASFWQSALGVTCCVRIAKI